MSIIIIVFISVYIACKLQEAKEIRELSDD